jgi:hypothetical protein
MGTAESDMAEIRAPLARARVGDERVFHAPAEPFPNQLLDQAATPTYHPAARYALREGLELALLAAIQLKLGRRSTPPSGS